MQYQDNYVATIGVDVKEWKINMYGRNVKLQIWDTAGQERFRTLTPSFYRGAHAVVVAYDMTSTDSFKNVQRWLGDVKEWNPNDDNSSVPIVTMIMATKLDLEEQRVVSRDWGEDLALQRGVLFEETSAKEDTNIDSAFTRILINLLKAHMNSDKSGAAPNSTASASSSSSSSSSSGNAAKGKSGSSRNVNVYVVEPNNKSSCC